MTAQIGGELAAKLVETAIAERVSGDMDVESMFAAIHADLDNVVPALVKLARLVTSMTKAWDEQPEVEAVEHLGFVLAVWLGTTHAGAAEGA